MTKIESKKSGYIRINVSLSMSDPLEKACYEFLSTYGNKAIMKRVKKFIVDEVMEEEQIREFYYGKQFNKS